MGKSQRRSRNRKIEIKNALTTIVPQKVLIVVAIIIFLLMFSTIFAVINSVNPNMLLRIQVEGINIANLEINDAYQKVEEEIKQRKQKNIQLMYEEYENTISLEQLEVSYDTVEAVNRAYKVGRNKNIIISNYEIIKTLLLGTKIQEEILINEEQLTKAIEDIASKIPGVMKESSYYIENDNLILYAGEEGIVVKKEELKSNIIQAIQKQMQGKEATILQIPVEIQKPTPLEIEKIYEGIYKEPQDAYYKEEPFEIITQEDGMDFAISIQEAKAMLEQTKEEYVIPLKITKPAVAVDSLGIKVFPDSLGKYTTRYDESNKNRTNNIKLSSEKINETILMPGETFSYNKVVGERTIKAGYKEAAIYMNGKVVDGIGGGICQVSSTLYNAVLDANLEIVKRTNHYFTTSYVPVSRDATVSYGTIDFQFKNNRSYPIKIQCTAKNGISEVEIKGIKEETEYEVVIQNEITEVIPYTTKYVETNVLEKGIENVIQKGSNGYKSQAYKVLKLNGKVISKTLLSKDSYNSMQRIIEIGTK